MSLMGDDAPPKRKKKVNGHLQKINIEREQAADEFSALCYELRVAHRMTLEQVRSEVVRRGFPSKSIQAIDAAWKRYSRRRPCENAVQLRKVEFEASLLTERRLLGRVNLVGADGEQVLPGLRVLLEVEKLILANRVYRMHLMGIAVRPEDAPQFDGSPVHITVGYPEEVRVELEAGEVIDVEGTPGGSSDPEEPE